MFVVINVLVRLLVWVSHYWFRRNFSLPIRPTEVSGVKSLYVFLYIPLHGEQKRSCLFPDSTSFYYKRKVITKFSVKRNFVCFTSRLRPLLIVCTETLKSPNRVSEPDTVFCVVTGNPVTDTTPVGVWREVKRVKNSGKRQK